MLILSYTCSNVDPTDSNVSSRHSSYVLSAQSSTLSVDDVGRSFSGPFYSISEDQKIDELGSTFTTLASVETSPSVE